MPVDLPEEFLPEMVFLKQMTELQDGRFIRHRLPAEVDTHEPAHGDRFIQGLFRSRIGEVEPLLEKIDPEHAQKPHRRPTVLALRVIGCDHRAKVLPGHDLLHVRKELLATGGFPMGLEGAGG